MQLVEDQEPQPAARLVEEALVLRPDQHQLGHHVVGQHDVRRLLPHGLTIDVGGFARISGERHRERPAGAPLITFPQLFERLDLGVYQCVHRVDDQSAHAVRRGRLAQEAIDDRQKVGEAFSGAGAACDTLALPGSGQVNGLDLVLVEMVGHPVRVPVDSSGLCKQDAAARQVVDRRRAGLGRAHLDQ